MGAAAVQGQAPGERAVVTASKALQIPQALAIAQDPEHRHQQQVPGRGANAPPHLGIRDRLEVADQIEIGCCRGGVGHKEEAIPPSKPHAGSSGQSTRDTL